MDLTGHPATAVVPPWTITLAFPLLASLLAYHFLFPYLVTYAHLRQIPGPLLARLSNLWLLAVSRQGRRSLAVDDMHRAHGKFVRVQPDHVSIADEDAIAAVYGHGNGLLKAEFYEAFVSIRRGLFSTRSRAEHSRKRKIVSHTFSARSISQFEPYMRDNLRLFVAQIDRLIEQSDSNVDGAVNGNSTVAAREAHVDILPWFNYLAFDIIGDLAFGAPFGMLARGADMAEVRATPDSTPVLASAISILNRRGEVSAALGSCPPLRPWAHLLPDPFFSRGLAATKDLAGLAIARVKDRLDNPPPTERLDLLARLIEARDEKGEPLPRDELTAEAQTQLIAGSDTTSNSSCALLDLVARSPRVLAALTAELDAAIPDDVDVPTHAMVRNLPYLDAVVNETLRLHCTSGLGLPRLIPPDSQGLIVCGKFFPPGTVLSVPTYTIHRSREIWGPDAHEFRPERWAQLTARQKNAFIPFSHGPRACVGRNVAEMEMKLIVATWARRYGVRIRQGPMETREGFLRKPLGLEIALWRR